jgi:hypothetical protein
VFTDLSRCGPERQSPVNTEEAYISASRLLKNSGSCKKQTAPGYNPWCRSSLERRHRSVVQCNGRTNPVKGVSCRKQEMVDFDATLAAALLKIRPPTTRKCQAFRNVFIKTFDWYILHPMPCASWRCPACRPVAVWKWGLHLAEVMWQTPEFYRATVAKDSWVSARTSIGRPRKGKPPGNFARVCDLVVSTAPVPFDKSDPIDLSSALRLIGQVLNTIDPKLGIGERFQPVSTSRKWALPKREKTINRAIGIVPRHVSLDAVRFALERHNIPFQNVKSGIRVPAWIEESDARAVVEALQKHR